MRDQDTQLYLIPFMLGEAESRRRNWPAAAAEFKQCLDLNPTFDQAMLGLAHALVNNNDFDGARPWVEKALDANRQNYRAWYLLGAIDAKADKTAALADYEKAVSIQGSFAPLRRDLGILLAEQQNYPQAVIHLEKALALGLEDAPVYNFLGIAYSKTNRPVKAIESYRKAIKLDPKLAEAHLNLGFAYQKQNRRQAALEEYKAACALREKYCEIVPSTRQ